MNCLIVSSKIDPAGSAIVKALKKNFPVLNGFSFHEVSKEIIFSEIGKETLEGFDLVVFASKHKSESGRPTLTCHSIGNFGKAEMGGKDSSLVPTNPKILANYLRSMHKLNDEKKLGFEVALEVTHHGPFLEKPSVFIEIGSSEKEWSNKVAAEIIAETIATQTFASPKSEEKIAIGIGGGHYAPDFTKLILRKNYSFGHICPLHSLENLDEDLLSQMIQKSGAKEIVLNWKGLKEHKQKVTALCEKSGLQVSRVQDLLKK